MAIDRLIDQIASIKSELKAVIEDKGVKVASTVPFNKYHELIGEIEAAGTMDAPQIKEWTPDPKWFDIDKILEEDKAIPDFKIVDGVASGFSEGGSIVTNKALTFSTADSWEMFIKFTYKRINNTQTLYSENGQVWGSQLCIDPSASTPAIVLALGNTRSSNNIINAKGTTELVDGTTYYVKATMVGTAYVEDDTNKYKSNFKVLLSTTGEFAGEETVEIDKDVIVANTNTTNPSTIKTIDTLWSIGTSFDYTPKYMCPFGGTIDLNASYIKLDDEIVFDGSDETTYTVRNSGCIREGISINRAYTAPANYGMANPWEIMVKFTAGGTGVLASEQANNKKSRFGIFNNKLEVLFTSNHDWNNSNWDISGTSGTGAVGTTEFVSGQDYYIKAVFNGSNYIFYSSTTGEFNGEEVTELNLASTTTLDNSYAWSLCTSCYNGDSGQNNYYKSTAYDGFFDISKSYIKVGSKYSLEGNELVNLKNLDDPEHFGKAIFLLGNWTSDEDSRNWDTMTFNICSLFENDPNYYNAIKTSDGRLYTRVDNGTETITHTFDTTMDKDTSNSGVTTRYIILYYNRKRRGYVGVPYYVMNRFEWCFSIVSKGVNHGYRGGDNNEFESRTLPIYLKSIKIYDGKLFSDGWYSSWWAAPRIWGDSYLENLYVDNHNDALDYGLCQSRMIKYFKWPKYKSGTTTTGLVYNSYNLSDSDASRMTNYAQVINIENCNFKYATTDIFTNVCANGRVFEGIIDLSENELYPDGTFYLFNSYMDYTFKGFTYVNVIMPSNANLCLRVRYLSPESLKFLLDNAPEVTEQRTITVSTCVYYQLLQLKYGYEGIYKGKEYTNGVDLLQAKGWKVASSS